MAFALCGRSAEAPGVETKKSLHSLRGRGAWWTSACLVIHLAGNCGTILYSHLGLSFEVFTTMPPAPSPAPPPAPAPGPGGSPGPAPAPVPDRCVDDSRRLTGLAGACGMSDILSLQDMTTTTRMMGSCANRCGILLIRDDTCANTCVAAANHTSVPCGNCIGGALHCGAKKCLSNCMSGLLQPQCVACMNQQHCIATFDTCSGLSFNALVAAAAAGPTPSPGPASAPAPSQPTWYSLGTPGRISFSNSIRILFREKIYLLCAALLISSGINPYLECVLLGVVWFVPMQKVRRARLLWWINRAGRWSFLDVFFVVALCAGLATKLGGINVGIETRWSIYCFGIATIWARALGVWVEDAHRKCAGSDVEGARLACGCLRAMPVKTLEIMLGVAAFISFGLALAGTFGPFQTFLVEAEALNLRNFREFSALQLGEQTANYDLAGAIATPFLVAPYCMWGFLLNIAISAGCLIALLLGMMGAPRGKRIIIGICDMAGSAASVDVLLLATFFAARHFGGIVRVALACVQGGAVADNITAKGQLGWAFWLLLACVPAQWVIQEVAIALHDRGFEKQQQALTEQKASQDTETAATSVDPEMPKEKEPDSMPTNTTQEPSGPPPNETNPEVAYKEDPAPEESPVQGSLEGLGGKRVILTI